MSSCKITNKLVDWTIPKNELNEYLFGKSGLMYKENEYAGELKFSNTNDCNKNGCNKIKKKISTVKGDLDSVVTPLSIVNFHTHPLKCYIDNHTIYGWPSGEDMIACIDLCKSGNLTHIIFAMEGTYIITVNRNILNLLTDKDINKIEEIFKLTHNFRLNLKNMNKEFYNLLIKEYSLPDKFLGKNPLETWLNLARNINLKLLNNKKNTECIFDIQYFKNKYEKFYKNISIPSDIIYKASEINPDCSAVKV